jgi:hypothetical protein
MVLDAKALTWAAKHDIDTAKLKKAKVPIYGKWYFPEIPADVPLVNLETGEQQVFGERMIAGEVMYVPAAELQRAGLAPSDFTLMAGGPAIAGERALRTIAPEPLLAMARPPGYDDGTTLAIEPVDAQPMLMGGAVGDATGIHLPSASIAPFVLGVGFCILMLGVISNLIIFIVGLLWMLAGAVGWIRIGLLEDRAAAAHAAAAGEHH